MLLRPRIVRISDNPSAPSLGTEGFQTVREARDGQVVRGVAFTP
jgi:hypothetical protein